MTVFPSRNLPGSAEVWGRHMETQILQNTSLEGDLQQQVNNGLRANSGQLAVVSRQMSELFSRAVQLRTVPNMVVTGSAQTEPLPRANQFLTFDPAPRNTTALVQFSGQVSTSNPTPSHQAFLEVWYRGERVSRTDADFFRLSMRPPTWPASIVMTGFARIPVLEGVSPTIDLTLIRRSNMNSTTTTITLGNLYVGLTYAGGQA